jgi:DNA-binding FadR family transcriptional regulator
MSAAHPSPLASGRLHPRITSLLACRVIESERSGRILTFPKEADLCLELGVSRTIVREAMKVLADKGMIEMKPKAGTRSRSRESWRLLDPDILGWQAELGAGVQFLHDLCEVRLAIEPTAAGFAAVRASDEELARIEACLEERRKLGAADRPERVIDLDLSFQSAVVEASHNAMLAQLSASIKEPFRMALECASRFPAAVRLGLEAHEALVASLRRRDPLGARRAAEEVVGFAMLAIDKQTKDAAQRSRQETR